MPKWRSRPEISSARRVSTAGEASRKRAAVLELRAGLDQDAERRRVDELHAGEVDDDTLGLPRALLDQDVADRLGVVEVELARKRDDDRVAGSLDSRDGRLAQTLVLGFVAHDHCRVLAS